jgi:large subunit ribosomal protein L18
MNTKNLIKGKIKKHATRARRVRAKISGTALRPRLCVFRSNRHIWAQLIDDQAGKTLAAAGDAKMEPARASKTKEGQEASKKNEKLAAKCATAYEVGKEIAKIAQALDIKEVVFDRGGNKYHGRVKGLADGARSGGLKF